MNKSINESNLSAKQFEQLRTLYVDAFVNSMSHEDMLIYVTNDMDNFVDELSNQDLIEEIKYTLDETMLEEFVKQIKGRIV
tara:strand:+ start:213 stop:455 length:243 start_codon:yes stop_codon:yes gene_type:complete